MIGSLPECLKRQQSNVERLSLGRPDSARSWAEDRHNEKDRACHECQARHAKVHVSSHVLIGERGHTRANKRRLFLLRRRKRCQSEHCIDLIIALIAIM